MFVVPALKAVTKPLDPFTVATIVFELLQLPPASPLLVQIAVAPVQSDNVPFTVPAFTFGFTIKVLNPDKFPQPVNV